MAAIDPPRRKHHTIPNRRWLDLGFGELQDLAPAWSSLPFDGEANRPASALCTRPNVKDSSIGWIVLTHICARWRAVGLDLSRLWGDIIFVFPKARDTVLSRSRDAPLSFDFDTLVLAEPYLSPIKDSHSLFDLTLSQVQRASVITIPQTLRWDASLLRNRQLPHLQVLHVHTAPIAEPSDGASRLISSGLLASRLKQAVFKTAYIPFVAPALQYLELDRLTIKINQSTLLDILVSSSRLEELVLSQAVASASERTEPLSPWNPIQLPQLTVIRLYEPLPSISFLKHINFSLEAEARFVVQSPSENTSLKYLLDLIAPRLRDPTIDHLRIDIADSLRICIASSNSSEGEPAPRTAFEFTIDAVFSATAAGSGAEFLAEVLRRMNPKHIRLLHADFCREPAPGFEPADVMDALLPLSALTTLSVSMIDHYTHPIIDMLSDTSTVPTTFFNALETLIVYSDDLGNLLRLSADDSYIPSLRQRWDHILSIVKHCMAVGRRLPRLVLKGRRLDIERLGADELNASACREISSFVQEFMDERETRTDFGQEP